MRLKKEIILIILKKNLIILPQRCIEFIYLIPRREKRFDRGNNKLANDCYKNDE
jgi:hypothetical protein